MRKEKLYNVQGGYVVTVMIAPFLKRCKIVVWGSRIFLWNEKQEQYREEFTTTALTLNHEDA